MNTVQNQRILLIDDMPSIQDDFRKVLCNAVHGELDGIKAALFGETAQGACDGFELDSAYRARKDWRRSASRSKPATPKRLLEDQQAITGIGPVHRSAFG